MNPKRGWNGTVPLVLCVDLVLQHHESRQNLVQNGILITEICMNSSATAPVKLIEDPCAQRRWETKKQRGRSQAWGAEPVTEIGHLGVSVIWSAPLDSRIWDRSSRRSPVPWPHPSSPCACFSSLQTHSGFLSSVQVFNDIHRISICLYLIYMYTPVNAFNAVF